MLGLTHHLRDLRRDGGRVVLTTLGVVWGTLAVTVLIAFGESASHSVLEAERGMGVGLVVVQNGATSRSFGGLPAARAIRLASADVDVLERAVPGIAFISGEYTRGSVDLSYRGVAHNVSMSAVEPPYARMRNTPPQPGGRFINALDIGQRRRTIFLGDKIKARVFGTHDAVGETVLVRGTPFTVVGVMRPKTQWSSYQGSDEWRAFIPLTTYETMWGKHPISAIVFQSADRAETRAVVARVRRVLAGRHRFAPEDPFALSIWDTTDGAEITESIHFGVRIFMGLIGVVTLIVAGIGVGNAMYMLVRSRTREIGIKIAVGGRPRDITIHHLMEGAIIVVAGGALGVFASWLLVAGLNLMPIEEEALLFLGRPKLSVITVLCVTTLLGLVGLVAGLFPARRAARTDPVEALRYE